MTGKTQRAHAPLRNAEAPVEDADTLQAEVEMLVEPEPAQTGEKRLESEADWQRVLIRLRAELGEDVFNTWLKTLQLDGVSDGVCA